MGANKGTNNNNSQRLPGNNNGRDENSPRQYGQKQAQNHQTNRLMLPGVHQRGNDFPTGESKSRF